MNKPKIHPTAEVSPDAVLGEGVRIWNQVQVREDASIGNETSIGKNCYIDFGVSIGSRCKIQNNVSVYHGVTILDGVFLGPHVCFTNDKIPRAINPDGSLKGTEDWTVDETIVETGASIGANSVILPGIRIGRFCLIGSGSVVTHNVPANTIVIGNPARFIGWICDCGFRFLRHSLTEDTIECKKCGKKIIVRES
jgi:acetyltransferase-like isoleucine patch superfamily enzyme